eukprot:364076-Chlamydomonas_euryale.AAC.14
MPHSGSVEAQCLNTSRHTRQRAQVGCHCQLCWGVVKPCRMRDDALMECLHPARRGGLSTSITFKQHGHTWHTMPPCGPPPLDVFQAQREKNAIMWVCESRNMCQGYASSSNILSWRLHSTTALDVESLLLMRLNITGGGISLNAHTHISKTPRPPGASDVSRRGCDLAIASVASALFKLELFRPDGSA